MNTNADNEMTELMPVKDSESGRGARGKLGVATAGLLMRQRWHADGAPERGTSLKQFARALLKQGDQMAKEWFANKKGVKNQKRSEKNIQRIAAERTATKASRRKSGKK